MSISNSFKRKLSELEQLYQDLKDSKDTTQLTQEEKKACVKSLKTTQDGLIKMYNELKEPDYNKDLWTDAFTLKLTGFRRGLHPTTTNVKDMFLSKDIRIDDTVLITDEYDDFILVSFRTPHDKARAKYLNDMNCVAKNPGGVTKFVAKLSEPNEF